MSRPLGRSMLATGAASIGFTFLTFLSGVLIARLLGTEGRGLYGAVMFWAQFSLVFFAFSFRESATVFLRGEDGPPEKKLSSLLLYAVGLTSLTFLIIIAVNEFGIVSVKGVTDKSLVSFVMAVCAISFFSQAFISIEAAKLNFTLLNQDRLLAPGLFSLALIAMYLFNVVNLSFVLIAFVVTKLPVLTMWVIRYRRDLTAPSDDNFLGQVSRLGAKFHAATAFTLISQQIDRLIIVAAWPAEQLGFYFVAYSAAGAGFSAVSQAIGITLLPSLAGSQQKERRDRLERILRYTILAAIGFSFAIIVTAPFIIPLVFGTDFAPAVRYTQGLALALAFVPIRSVVLEANRAVSRGRPGLEMAIASLVVFLAIFFLTGFTDPSQLFWAIGLSHVTAIITGLRHPIRHGDLRPTHGLIPRPGDVLFLAREIWRHHPGRTSQG